MSKSPTTTEQDVAFDGYLEPLHPGEFLLEEYMKPLGLSAGRLAKACGVPRTRIERIVREELGVSADTSLRLGRVLETSPEFWLGLQKQYEMSIARRIAGAEIDAIKPLDRAA
jgi:addiction module HigA family antidote